MCEHPTAVSAATAPAWPVQHCYEQVFCHCRSTQPARTSHATCSRSGCAARQLCKIRCFGPWHRHATPGHGNLHRTPAACPLGKPRGSQIGQVQQLMQRCQEARAAEAQPGPQATRSLTATGALHADAHCLAARQAAPGKARALLLHACSKGGAPRAAQEQLVAPKRVVQPVRRRLQRQQAL